MSGRGRGIDRLGCPWRTQGSLDGKYRGQRVPVFMMKMQAGLSTSTQRPLPCPGHVPAFPAPFASRTVSKQ